MLHPQSRDRQKHHEVILGIISNAPLMRLPFPGCLTPSLDQEEIFTRNLRGGLIMQTHSHFYECV